MSIPLWEECAWSTPNQSENVSSLTESNSDSIFAVNPVINEKIYLHLGPGYKIPCDACIVGQNEQLSDRMEDNAAVFALAGPVVESELQALAPIQTGESVITSGGSLPCEWLIHAVGPRYDERYLTASDHALFSAYKSSLLFATEKNASSIVLTCIYSRKKKFPRFDAAHVVLRTLRKFLQQPVGETIKRVMICVPSQEDYDIYTTLLCAYFPRNIHELESQQNLLPAELGDDWGELVLPDRALKVSVGPQPLTKEGLEEYRRSSWTSKTGEDTEMVGNEGQRKKTGSSQIVAVGDTPTSMTKLGVDKDAERRAKIAQEFSHMSRIDRMKLRFQAMLEDLELEELDDLEPFDFVRVVGEDAGGRAVVTIVASSLQDVLEAKASEFDRILLYFMKIMEPLRCKPFILVYCVGGLVDNHITNDATASIFDLFAARYNENLMGLYILHATFMLRMYMWVALPFLSTPFWKNYVCVANLQQLDRIVEINKLKLPSPVVQFDKTLY